YAADREGGRRSGWVRYRKVGDRRMIGILGNNELVGGDDWALIEHHIGSAVPVGMQGEVVCRGAAGVCNDAAGDGDKFSRISAVLLELQHPRIVDQRRVG